jgi:integration host factor subunit alpha
MTVTKETIIRQFGHDAGLSRLEAKKTLDTLLTIIYDKLIDGESVLISGFGKFTVLSKNPRLGRNPHTMEEIQLQARRVVTFHASENLREKTNYDAEFLRRAIEAQAEFNRISELPGGHDEPIN